MKVNVNFTIDVNEEDWEMNYGISGAKAIREDVKNYAKIVVVESFNSAGIATR